MSIPTHFQSRSKPMRVYRMAIIGWVITLLMAPSVFAGSDTALDDYVNELDPNYTYFALDPLPGPGFKLHLLNMVSQQWRTLDEVNRTLWRHWLGVIVPEIVDTETAMLIILGGSNSATPTFDEDELAVAVQIAMNSRSVVALLGQVPNQPLLFADEPLALREDALVAYTWDKAMRTGDWTWPAYLPMVKSAVRAMDTVQEYVPMVSHYDVSRFVVTGFSKRGATTWLAAAVDPRVQAIAPGVINFLNLAPHIEHHFRAYGFYSDAVDDYVNYEIVRRVRTPEGQALLQVVDPYSYLDRLDMPKFLINSPGDQFFLPDSARFYIGDLLGENLLRYVPNTDHSLTDPSGNIDNTVISLASWYSSILYSVARPYISWQQENGQLWVVTDQTQVAARLWQATNPVARDFRRETIGPTWTSEWIAPTGPGVFVANVSPPVEGWTAYYVELIFPDSDPTRLPQTYSTQVYVTPDTLPFELIDPLREPQGVRFWKHQVRLALTGRYRAQVPADVLAGYFPITVFDTNVTDLADAAVVFKCRKSDPQAPAIQNCLAVRLNVANKQLGWYTRLSLDDVTDEEDEDVDEGKMALWEYWEGAHNAFIAGDPQTAKEICASINETDYDD